MSLSSVHFCVYVHLQVEYIYIGHKNRVGVEYLAKDSDQSLGKTGYTEIRVSGMWRRDLLSLKKPNYMRTGQVMRLTGLG